MIPLAMLAAGVGALGGGAQAISSLLGGNSAARAQRQALTQARGDLSTGFGQAKDFMQPIANTGMGAYGDVASQYKTGDFNTQPFKFDPNAVFSDPEYQAQMRAGKQAIGQDEFSKGRLFSGNADRDLTQFGNDLFTQRSNDLFGRGMAETNQAAQLKGQQFAEGMSIAQPGIAATGTLAGLATGEGEALASNSLGRGDVNAMQATNTANSLGSLLGGISQAPGQMYGAYQNQNMMNNTNAMNQAQTGSLNALAGYYQRLGVK